MLFDPSAKVPLPYALKLTVIVLATESSVAAYVETLLLSAATTGTALTPTSITATENAHA